MSKSTVELDVNINTSKAKKELQSLANEASKIHTKTSAGGGKHAATRGGSTQASGSAESSFLKNLGLAIGGGAFIRSQFSKLNTSIDKIKISGSVDESTKAINTLIEKQEKKILSIKEKQLALAQKKQKAEEAIFNATRKKESLKIPGKTLAYRGRDIPQVKSLNSQIKSAEEFLSKSISERLTLRSQLYKAEEELKKLKGITGLRGTGLRTYGPTIGSAYQGIRGSIGNIGRGIGGFIASTPLSTAAVAAAPVAAAAVPVGAILGGYKVGSALADEGGIAQANFEKTSVALEQLNKNFGGVQNIELLSDTIVKMSANGVNSVESLTGAAETLMVAFKGKEAINGWLSAIDDMAVASGLSADRIAELIAMTEQQERVDARVFTTMASRGIPIYEKLAEVLGVSSEEAKKMAKSSKVMGEEAQQALKLVAEGYKGISAALSSKTLEGAKATQEAMGQLAQRGWAVGRNSAEITTRNEIAAGDEELSNDLVYQSIAESYGRDLLGRIDSMILLMKEWPGTIAESIFDIWSRITNEDDDALNYTLSKIEAESQKYNLDAAKIAEGYTPMVGMTGPDGKNVLTEVTSAMVAGWQSDIEKRLQQLDITSKGERWDSLDEDTQHRIQQLQISLTTWSGMLENAKRELEAREAQVKSKEEQEKRKEEAKTYNEKELRALIDKSETRSGNSYDRRFHPNDPEGYEDFGALFERLLKDFHDINGFNALKAERDSLRSSISAGSHKAGDIDRLDELNKLWDYYQKAQADARERAGKSAYIPSWTALGAKAKDPRAQAQENVAQLYESLKDMGFDPSKNYADYQEAQLQLTNARIKELEKSIISGTFVQSSASGDEGITLGKARANDGLGGHSYISNAWGAACAVAANFDRNYDQKQYEELKQISDAAAQEVELLRQNLSMEQLSRAN